MKERLKEIGYWFEDKLKGLCGEITPDKRLMVILIMLLLFTVGNLYFTISSIYNWGRDKERREQLKIEHIRQLKLQKSTPTDREFDFLDSDIDITESDSINHLKTDKSYGG